MFQRKSTIQYNDSSSSESDDDLNQRQHQTIEAKILKQQSLNSCKTTHKQQCSTINTGSSRDLTQSVKEFKRVKRVDGVNFKSLTRENNNSNYTMSGDENNNNQRRSSSRLDSNCSIENKGEIVASPKVCVTYRGSKENINAMKQGSGEFGGKSIGMYIFKNR